MIRIVTEADSQMDLASILDPVSRIEGVVEMQRAVRVLQGHIQKSKNANLRPLRLGVESVYYALWPLTDLKRLRRQTNLWIQERDTSDGKSPVLTVADFRKWLNDDFLSWTGADGIEQTMNYLTTTGSEKLKPLFKHTEAEETDYSDPKVGYVKIELKGNQTLLKDLIAQGTKGGSYNAYGPFEKLLGIMLWCWEFPQSGKAGSGDLKFGNELVEVKSCNNDSLKSNCVVPAGGSLLLVRGNTKQIEVLCFRNQAILDRVLRKGEMYSSKPNKVTGKRERIPNKIDKKGVNALFDKAGRLNRNYLRNAGYLPKTAKVEDEPLDDVADDDDEEEDSVDVELA